MVRSAYPATELVDATSHLSDSSRSAGLAGWGRFPVAPGEAQLSEDLVGLTARMPLTRGAGRAYGDAALPASVDRRVAASTMADRILGFDPDTGLLTAESGLSVEDIYRVFLPRGYFTPVSPGTRFVTLGGMVASDVHGKNHHCEGTIGRHVESLRLRVGTGDVVTCSRTSNPDLFRATLGGMGLTGHILEVNVRLARVPSPWIVAERERIDDLTTFVGALAAASRRWPMTAGWIDCLAGGQRFGRGVLFRGRWAAPDEAPAAFPCLRSPVPVPFTCPDFLLSKATVGALNALNYWTHLPRVRRAIVHPPRFFYPLDSLGNWNRLYGKRGFIQYQCVLPVEAGPSAAVRFLLLLKSLGGAFLCVIKDCGREGLGHLSFPRPGVSIAVDMPRHHNAQSIVDTLNQHVIDEGGRIYLAKDALTRPEHFRRMEPRLEEFLAVRRRWDPAGRVRSALSVRLFGW
jgi:decaprenylphospho-beta-D-ribofuranose 2-oxidase